MVGYIAYETESHWIIQLMNNSEVQLRRGTWEEEEGEYHFPACDISDCYITKFWPV